MGHGNSVYGSDDASDGPSWKDALSAGLSGMASVGQPVKSGPAPATSIAQGIMDGFGKRKKVNPTKEVDSPISFGGGTANATYA